MTLPEMIAALKEADAALVASMTTFERHDVNMDAWLLCARARKKLAAVIRELTHKGDND